ncbi:MAG TPA: aminodeoxychorismate/anthranilate synthase component II [Chlamydiales bacterium]|nr:aminodeoxychorismate/anthranilate synthase component II [Chlamydiales bacterium]
MLLIIDNYDSFTYNLYQAFAEIDPDVQVVKNDQITVEEIRRLGPSGIVLSPGPGRPEDAGICIDVIREFAGKVPILGVCLGHQAIGVAFGAEVKQAGEIMHGKDSLIFHSRKGLFKGMPLPFKAGRYHSLLVEKLPAELIVDAETPDGVVMAMHHVKYPVYGVQFHPESILTPEGKILMKNFLEMCK